MLLCKTRKIGVFFPPKTGSSTISELFKGVNLDVNSHHHKRDPEVSDPENYTFYGFYRDPIERYLSGLNYTKRLNYGMLEILQFFYSERISCARNPSYADLTDEQKFMIDSLHPMEYFRKFVKTQNAGIVFGNQINWLGKFDVNLLDFRDFENQVKFLCEQFDMKIDTVPKINESKAKHKVSELSASDIQELKDFYAVDYDFFESRGIRL